VGTGIKEKKGEGILKKNQLGGTLPMQKNETRSKKKKKKNQ